MTQTATISAGGISAVCVAGSAKPTHRARQWELVEFAGLGSLAHIYRARPIGSPPDRTANYAVKMLRPCWQDDEHAVRLLQREALVGQGISNPHLVPVLSSYVREQPRLLVMPWLEGASLATRLAEGQPFGVPEALWIARQTAEALDALHKADWMHGDVSTGNIHISSTGHVTLLDFNFARRRDEYGSAVDRPIMGTCRYLAPEYLTSALRSDIRSDIYSLGVILFEVLAGRRPFNGETLVELSIAHRQSGALDLTRLAPYVPNDVAQLVRRMMAKDPLRRPQTPRELIDRLVALEIATFSERAG
jgi:eukaryotic-like serine/threonine-protein kinase